jgi:pimeloyl-ACP methyl ester carboxylesterase
MCERATLMKVRLNRNCLNAVPRTKPQPASGRLTLLQAGLSLKAKPFSVSVIRETYLDSAGVRLRYRDEGHGPAVILLHGWTFDLEMWDPQVATLRDEFRLVRFDRRGHGFSGGVADSEADAADIAALCRRLQLRSVALLGMSQGARGALRFASEAPDQVTALILDGPPNLRQAAVDDDVPMNHFRELARSGGLDTFRREWSNHALVQLCTEATPMQSRVQAMIARYPGRELLIPPATATARPPITPERIRVPALVLSGAYDLPSRMQSARELCAQLPAAEHVTLPEAGHLINLDQPALYSRLCRAFLQRHTPAAQ